MGGLESPWICPNLQIATGGILRQTGPKVAQESSKIYFRRAAFCGQLPQFFSNSRFNAPNQNVEAKLVYNTWWKLQTFFRAPLLLPFFGR
jgi:hypothetical protein